jgi:5-methylcytosine-specific restriction endonuclease McrA
MKYSTIQQHLQPYIIEKRRKTTINHAFAAAVSPNDSYDENRVQEAIKLLNQNPDESLNCVYCGVPAKTWDHVFATVKNSEFSGQGHRLGNLLPCCKQCNSSKGSKNWLDYLKKLNPPDLHERKRRISAYLDCYNVQDELIRNSSDYKELMEIRDKVIQLMGDADLVAARIRNSRKIA